MCVYGKDEKSTEFFFFKCVANVKDETATLPSTGIHSGSLVLLTGERFNVIYTHTLKKKEKGF